MGALSKNAKEAMAMIAAVGLVGGALLLGGRADAASPPTTGRPVAAQTVVAVADEAADAARQWRDTPMAVMPGEVVVMPPVSAPSCAQEVSEASRADAAIRVVATCSASAPADDASRTATFHQAVERARQTGGAVVLLGEGWEGYIPLPLATADFEDPAAVSLALKDARLAGAIPDLSGVSLVLAVPDSTAAMQRVWKEYASESRAASYQWLPV